VLVLCSDSYVKKSKSDQSADVWPLSRRRYVVHRMREDTLDTLPFIVETYGSSRHIGCILWPLGSWLSNDQSGLVK